MHVKVGDLVEVISGKDKGKTGKVVRTLFKHDTVEVEGVNIAKRHTKPSRTNSQGGILAKAIPLPVCKVRLVNKPEKTEAAPKKATKKQEKK